MEGAAEMTVLQYLHHVDQSLTLAVNSLNSPFSDRIWMFFSSIPVWIPLYAVVAFFLLRNLGWKRGLTMLLACGLTFAACDQCGNFVKDAVERLRPCWDLNMVNGGLHILEDRGGLYGFYSAHAANAMGFAWCSVQAFSADSRRNYRPYRMGITVWALLVGFSRVFVGKHFLGDVCAGFIVGLVFASVFAKVAFLTIRRFGLES